VRASRPQSRGHSFVTLRTGSARARGAGRLRDGRADACATKDPLLGPNPRILRSNKLRFEFVLGSFFNALPVFSITYWLRSYIFRILLGLLQASGRGPFLCPSAFRGAIPPPGRRLHGKAHYLNLIRAFGTQIRVRFEFVSRCHPVFSITYWLRSYFLVLSRDVLPFRTRTASYSFHSWPGTLPARQMLYARTHSFDLVRTFVTPTGDDGNRRQGLKHRKHEMETDQTLRAECFRPGQISIATPHSDSSLKYQFGQVPRKLTLPTVRRKRGWRIQEEQCMRHPPRLCGACFLCA